MTYNPVYPDGWHNKPNQTTPLSADALAHMEQGIVDADAAARTAQATANAAVGIAIVLGA